MGDNLRRWHSIEKTDKLWMFAAPPELKRRLGAPDADEGVIFGSTAVPDEAWPDQGRFHFTTDPDRVNTAIRAALAMKGQWSNELLLTEQHPDVPQKLLEFADHYQAAMRWPIHRMEELLQLPNGITGWLMPASASDTDVACGVWDGEIYILGIKDRQTANAVRRACRGCDRSSRRPRTERGLTWLLVATARSWTCLNNRSLCNDR